jgi:anti-sigma-K factor RskA
MADSRTEEQASLYVLDLLEAQEKRDFEERRRVDPEVDHLVRELQVGLEGLALGVAPAVPHPRVMEKILEEAQGRSRAQLMVSWLKAGLPLAACLALGWLIATYTIPRHYRVPGSAASTAGSGNSTRSVPPGSARLPVSLSGSNAVADGSTLQAQLAAQQKEVQRLGEAWQREQARNQALTSRVNDLTRQAASLEARQRQYALAEPGLKRLTIIDLRDPRHRTTGTTLADDANRILTADAAARLGAANSFVANQDSGAGTVADNSKSLNPTATDTATRGSTTNTVSTGFTPPPPTTASTDSTPTPQAVAIVDLSLQSGTLVLQGIPPLPDNHVYQLWANDPQYPEPLLVGFLPALANGSGQVSFSLPTGYVIPTRFTVTLESGLGSTTPAGLVILDGPP